ncbi:phenylalanine--tRNA ligase subunit beta, partial [Candidatus Uhrbacteria bacterium]|nr:phenylalanine--tRNA ligase subunit beta [Candidatus Uhrbacteria bacterium]
VVFDIEITTNRPDLMSVEELAREVATITHSSFRPRPRRAEKSPIDRPEISRLRATALEMTKRMEVRIEDRKACARYGAVVMDGVTVAPSPWWMQRRLLAAGLRPINNVVDVTNYVMCELGQPLHAFDAVKLIAPNALPPTFEISNLKSQIPDGVAIIVRRASAGESIVALDGNTYSLTPDVLVIAAPPSPEASEGKAIALAGIVGGKETGVTGATTRIVLECANFDPMVIRRGVRQLNVRTDSSTRFEKGLQPEAIEAVLPRAVELLTSLTGGVDGKPTIVGKQPTPQRPIALRPTDASDRIGVVVPPTTMRRTLVALGCAVQKKTSGVFFVTPPWWRRGDLEGAHDLVEEIARVYGYHRLPSVLPIGTLPAGVRTPEPPQTPFDWEDRGRDILTGTGVTELMATSLTSREAIERCGYTTEQCVALENPLSEELAYLRPSLIPTLLPIIAGNQGHTPNARLFELGNVYIPQAFERRGGVTSPPVKQPAVDQLPREEPRLLVAAYGRMVSGGHVMQVKGVVEHLFDRLGIRDATFRTSEQCELPSGVCAWHPGRTMDVIIGGVLVGVLGEIHPAVVERFGISARVAAADLDWAPILAACRSVVAVVPPPTFPAVKRDLAFTVDRRTPYADIAAVLERFDALLTYFELFDQYEGGTLPIGKKSIAFHLTYSASDRTLTAVEVDALQTRLVSALQQRFGAEVRE